MKEKLGQEPAFPNTDAETFCNDGMSKCFYAACAAMQGIIAANKSEIMMLDCESTIRYAYQYADELLKQENE